MDNSKSDTLHWLNTLLQSNVTRVEHLNNGVVYCKLLHTFDPTCMNFSRVNQKAKTFPESIQNLKLVQGALVKLHMKKLIDIDKICKGQFQENNELLAHIRKQFTIKGLEKENQKPTTQAQKVEQQRDDIFEQQTILLQNTIDEITRIVQSEQIPAKKLQQIRGVLNIPENELPHQMNIFRTDSKRKMELQEYQRQNVILCETPHPQDDILMSMHEQSKTSSYKTLQSEQHYFEQLNDSDNLILPIDNNLFRRDGQPTPLSLSKQQPRSNQQSYQQSSVKEQFIQESAVSINAIASENKLQLSNFKYSCQRQMPLETESVIPMQSSSSSKRLLLIQSQPQQSKTPHQTPQFSQDNQCQQNGYTISSGGGIIEE